VYVRVFDSVNSLLVSVIVLVSVGVCECLLASAGCLSGVRLLVADGVFVSVRFVCVRVS